MSCCMCVLIVDAKNVDKSWDLNVEDVKEKSDDVHKSELLLERWRKLGEAKLDIAAVSYTHLTLPTNREV